MGFNKFNKNNPKIKAQKLNKRLDFNNLISNPLNINSDLNYLKDMSSCEESLLFESKIKEIGPLTFIYPDLIIKNVILSDDFYSNIMDWCDKYIFYSNGTNFYQINTNTNKREKIHSFKRMITSVKALNKENIILGFVTGSLILFNLKKNLCYDLPEHISRISTIDIYNNEIYTGSRDKLVRFYDLRSNDINEINRHQQEVTGIKINQRGDMLASGGNDNKIFVYDKRINKIMFENEHKAAVRAIAWSKFNLLATGGGTADRKIKLWNMSNLKKQNEILFNSQICNLYWTKNNKIISTHGYSQNDVKVSDIELKLEKVYHAHKNRVMHFAINNTESQFITGSADNCLKFWEL